MFHQRPPGARVDHDLTRHGHGKSNPKPRAQTVMFGLECRAHTFDTGNSILDHVSRDTLAITVRTPVHAAIRAAASFEAMPPEPRSATATRPPPRPTFVINFDNLFDQRGILVQSSDLQ